MIDQKPKLGLRQKAHRPGQLRTISLDVTSRCNMACKHCYAETFLHVEPVPLETLKGALEELYELGVFHYVLQGGEAIADLDRLESIISWIHPDETYINVVSNGWLMTRERVRWLKDRQVDKVCFSLDSGIEADHDANRAKGSYKRVMRAVDDALEEGLLVAISTVVTRTSLHEEGFRIAYEYAAMKGIRIDIQIAEPVGNWEGRKDLLMRPEDSEYIKNLQRTCPVLKNGQRMVNRDIYSGTSDHCPAGGEFMAISSTGVVQSCNFLQFSLGRIGDRPIKDMRDDLLKSPWFQGVPNCLCGENEEFIETFITPYVGQPKPLDAYKVFGLKKD